MGSSLLGRRLLSVPRRLKPTIEPGAHVVPRELGPESGPNKKSPQDISSSRTAPSLFQSTPKKNKKLNNKNEHVSSA